MFILGSTLIRTEMNDTNISKNLQQSESALYRLEGGWIGDFYESLQNVGVMKTNSEDYAYYYAAEVRLH